MQTNKIMTASLIDLIFDGHNKDYGAYELRKNYSKRINRAVVVTLTLAALICSTVMLASNSKNEIREKIKSSEVEIANLDEKPIEPLPEPERPREPEPVRTEAYTAPIIMPTDVIDRPLPTIESMDSSLIGIDKIKGPGDDGIPKPEDLDKGTKIVEGPKKDPEDEGPISIVEIDARFVGNWVAFLERNLDANVPRDNGAAVGRYSVVIQFVVDKEGVVSDITPLTNHGFGMEAEAVRVLKKAAKWEPAIQNGHKVKAYRRQVIVFVINDDE